ncbi:MAG: LysE family translocator [Pseudomonadota bacterium]|nr:LysE family translocator [Pseudomonadota bacterium]MEC8262251.1 LysE family translocator [Pseudomonadota bacterium]
MDELNWPLMLGAGIVASASPGPATLGIAGTSMRHGRRAGLSLSAGVMAGSYIWSATAAFGVGAILLAHVWVLETVRYCGGAYLIWLAARSLRSAMVPGAGEMADMPAPRGHFMAGLALHITNPKPILFFGTLFSIGVPAGTGAGELALVVLVIGLNNAAVFFTYAFLFSNEAMATAYARARRWFEGVFAALFGIAGLQILTMRLTQ